MEFKHDFPEEIGKLLASINRMRKLFGDATPVMRQVGKDHKRDYLSRFDRMEEPEGRPWVDLSPSYRAVKLRHKDKILTLSSEMKNTSRHFSSKNWMEFGNTVDYARLHQFGGDTDKGYVPARPHQGWGESDQARALNTIANAVVSRFTGQKIAHEYVDYSGLPVGQIKL